MMGHCFCKDDALNFTSEQTRFMLATRRLIRPSFDLRRTVMTKTVADLCDDAIPSPGAARGHADEVVAARKEVRRTQLLL